MAFSAREPLAAQLLMQADLLRDRALAPAEAASVRDQADALGGLAAFVSSLPDSDERLLVLGTLAVRGGQFVAGGATLHAIRRFTGMTAEAREAFLTTLVHVARDDALARARAHGLLPQARPRFYT
jgi:hypothetical protein